MKLLVTGFEPFGGETVNPSLEAMKRLPDILGGADVVKQALPTEFGRAGDVLANALEEYRPDAVICVGQAGGRSAITVERVAINLRDAAIPDNGGHQPVDEPILPEGETAYFSTLPIKAMVERIKGAGLPAFVSNTAGTYVCNEVLYTLLHLAKTKYPGLQGCFIHVPYTMEQLTNKPNGTPGMSMEDITRALICAAEAAVEA